MRQTTNKEQTQALINLGFPQPSLLTKEDGEIAYTIGELIEFLDIFMISIHTDKLLDYAMHYRIMYTHNPKTVAWKVVQGELIDKIFYACIELKNNNII